MGRLGRPCKGILADKKVLKSLYVTRRMTPVEIAEIAGVSSSGVFHALVRNGIRIRSRSEARRLMWAKRLRNESVTAAAQGSKGLVKWVDVPRKKIRFYKMFG